ncbi:50S ribosomal protein L5 [Methanomassiliicoccus luminyensis]|mgnify:FL=1|jgi:large subunit ribosomal protein L5|uniref:50S ribosomal protein L5 n=1 Tax=Methanomassiliicoccus luminyensis TaxID=1080712 RepID=UPI000474EED6|nr:50S ribosomal protein L5 [Methanomassiliicoccus luminyensis]
MSDIMRAPRIEKVVINIGVGEAGERLNKAQKVLSMVAKQKPVITTAKVTNRDLGVRHGMPIGCKVTLRGETAEGFLRKALAIRDNRVASYSFDPQGNLSFGISDYTDFEGMKYDPEIGIFGMDVNVVFKRPGYRVAKRRIMAKTVPKEHRMTRAEAIGFMKERYNVEVVE